MANIQDTVNDLAVELDASILTYVDSCFRIRFNS